MNSLKAFMMSTLGSGSARRATDDTEAYALLETFDENRYYLSSLLHQAPGNRDIILHTFADGVSHTFDAAKKISIRTSTDRGQTFGAKATLYDPTDSTFQIQDPGIGMDSNGRLHIMAGCYTSVGTGGGTNELRYLYSDDNGATVSSPVVISLPAGSFDSFRMYGRVIECGTVLMAPAFFFTDEGTYGPSSARYVLRSTDGGENWAWVLIESSAVYINETELLAINDSVVIAVSRQEDSPFQYIMYKSVDAGLTWINCGVLSTGLIKTGAEPCRLHKFQLDDGTWVAAMYFSNREATPKNVYAMYGRLDIGVTAGAGLFKNTTRTQIATNASFKIMYGDVCHYNGNMNAIGAWTLEQSDVPLTDNKMIYFECPATHYGTIFSLTTPVTIYDNLAEPELIVSRRGLISNNANDVGVLNASAQMTSWKNQFPAPTSRIFTATAGGIVLDADGVAFDGTKALSNAAANWNFLSFATDFTNINYTVYFTARFGTTSDPAATYGLLGTAASAGSKGMCIFFDDNPANSRNEALVIRICRGVGGSFALDFVNQNIITPNEFHNYCVQIDMAQSADNDKVKLWIDNVFTATTVTSINSGVATGPTNDFQIGATGANVLPGIINVKDIIIQNAIDIESVRDDMVTTLMDLEGL